MYLVFRIERLKSHNLVTPIWQFMISQNFWWKIVKLKFLCDFHLPKFCDSQTQRWLRTINWFQNSTQSEDKIRTKNDWRKWFWGFHWQKSFLPPSRCVVRSRQNYLLQIIIVDFKAKPWIQMSPWSSLMGWQMTMVLMSILLKQGDSQNLWKIKFSWKQIEHYLPTVWVWLIL